MISTPREVEDVGIPKGTSPHDAAIMSGEDKRRSHSETKFCTLQSIRGTNPPRPQLPIAQLKVEADKIS